MYSWQLYLVDSILHIPCNLVINITRDWRFIRFLFNNTTLFFRNHPHVKFEKITIGDIPAEWILPDQLIENTIIYYLHGGGFCLGSIDSHRSYLSYLSAITNIKVLTTDYRLAPEYPFPAGLNDCMQVYKWLASQYPDHKIIIMGESAGGGLCLSILQYIVHYHLPQPVAGVLLSPWLDLTLSGDSLKHNASNDQLLKINNVARAAQLYYQDYDPTDPLISPLWGDMQGLPPLLIQASQSEILLADSLRLKDLAEQQGIKVQLELSPDMPHAWPFFASILPEARVTLKHINKFIQSL